MFKEFSGKVKELREFAKEIGLGFKNENFYWMWTSILFCLISENLEAPRESLKASSYIFLSIF